MTWTLSVPTAVRIRPKVGLKDVKEDDDFAAEEAVRIRPKVGLKVSVFSAGTSGGAGQNQT